MGRKKIFKLCLYSLGAIFSALFLIALGVRISTITRHGFSAEQYWLIIILGSVVSILCAVFSIVSLIVTLVKKGAVEEENPVNPTKNEGLGQTTVEKEAPIEGITNETAGEPITGQTVGAQAPVKKKRMSLAERRKQKLLEDPPEKSKPKKGRKAVVALCVAIIFNMYFTAWATFSDEICFHNYAYNRVVNDAPDDGELTNYRFYSDYLFRPYFIYKDGEREFKVTLSQRVTGDGYVDYVFHTEEKYAKVLDCALDKHTYLTVNLTARMYKDGYVEVDHEVIKERNGKTIFEYSKSGKIYSYKNVVIE